MPEEGTSFPTARSGLERNYDHHLLVMAADRPEIPLFHRRGTGKKRYLIPQRTGSRRSSGHRGPARVAHCRWRRQDDCLASRESPHDRRDDHRRGVEGCPAQIARQKYALGDVNVSLIHTMNGKVITIYHDTTSPRPYSRIHIVQGINGLFENYPQPAHLHRRPESRRRLGDRGQVPGVRPPDLEKAG